VCICPKFLHSLLCNSGPKKFRMLIHPDKEPSFLCNSHSRVSVCECELCEGAVSVCECELCEGASVGVGVVVCVCVCVRDVRVFSCVCVCG